MMGTFRVPVRVCPLSGEEPCRDLEMLVDTGAIQSIVPGEVLRSLGVPVDRRQKFHLADGTEIHRDVGYAELHCGGRRAITLAVFGEPADAIVLGALTLEELGFEVDPRLRILKPTDAWLLAVSGGLEHDELGDPAGIVHALVRDV